MLNEYENYARGTSFEEMFEKSWHEWSDYCKMAFSFWAFGVMSDYTKWMKQWGYSQEYIDSLIREQTFAYGKIPLEDYEKILSESIHNRDSKKMTLGKYFDGTLESGSYVAKAEATGDTYFSLGNKWDEIKKLYGLTNEEMFQIFNTNAIDYAIESGKTIRFAQDPRIYAGSALYDEWMYLQTKYDYYDLLLEEGYYYAIK